MMGDLYEDMSEKLRRQVKRPCASAVYGRADGAVVNDFVAISRVLTQSAAAA
jgi:hypothetical protein